MRWLEQGRHGAMDYMQRHGRRRARPQELVPGTLRVISARMDYLPPRRARCRRGARPIRSSATCRATRSAATITRCCARRLAQLAEKIRAHSASAHRTACSSTAARSWRKRSRATRGSAGSASTPTCSIGSAGSWFFLGEILTDLPLPIDQPATRSLRHVPRLHRCLPDAGDRRAVRARCDALHLLSHDRAARRRFPIEFRKAHGQPHLRLRRLPAGLPLEQVRAHRGGDATSRRVTVWTRRSWSELFAWSEAEFLARTEGSAIRRIGYECWLRNIAVALGNAPTSDEVMQRARQRGAMTRQRWCASTWSGRSRNTEAVGLKPDLRILVVGLAQLQPFSP